MTQKRKKKNTHERPINFLRKVKPIVDLCASNQVDAFDASHNLIKTSWLSIRIWRYLREEKKKRRMGKYEYVM